jgi:hypothetical protein
METAPLSRYFISGFAAFYSPVTSLPSVYPAAAPPDFPHTGSESMEEWLDRYHASTFELREIGVKAGAAL